MNELIYIYKVRAKLLAWMSAAILLTACSDDDTDRWSGETDFLQIAAYTQEMVSPSGAAATRAVTYPSKYKEYEGSSSIGVFMTPTTTEMTLISYEDNAWHSMVKVLDGQQYYIYGYMPAYATCTINPNTSFDNGAILTFKDVPSVMSEDFSVITGALQLMPYPDDDTENKGKPKQEGTLKAGTFAYTGQESGKNFVDLMFDHLYGALNISMNVYSGYDVLRTIKLKELKLRTSANDTPTKSKTTVTVTLNKTTDGTSPISGTGGVVFTPDPTSDDMDDMPFFQSATGEELTKVSKSFEGHFMPKDVTSFVLTSVYDVYDKQGNLVRKECTAQNKLEISTLFDGQDATKPGWRYNVEMTIMPTYLYVLSEPDLDNPTVVVN